MLFHICKGKNCKKIVWRWQESANLILHLENGKKKKIHLCFKCGESILRAGMSMGVPVHGSIDDL